VPDPTFFATPQDLRAWLEAHHETETELWVGYHRRATGRPSITWPESVDQALCFGWIDGVRKRVDDERYMIRFTPRKPTSTWSAVNVRRFGELQEAGLVHPAGLAAFERRREDRTAIYSYEQTGEPALPEAYEERLRAEPAASEYFAAQPRWYRRAAVHWVMQAKREETRLRRLEQLIQDSAAGRTVGPLTRPG